MKEIYLDRKIRKSMLFNRLKEAGNNAISIANDMLSLRKEINFNEVTNLVLVKVNRKGMKLDEAFKHVNIFLNDEIEDVAEIGHKLRNVFPNNVELDRYILSIENAIDGHLRWYPVCHRYGNIKLMFKKRSKL